MQKAKAEVDFAEIEYKTQNLWLITILYLPNELAMVKAKLDKANAELALAKVHFDFTEIRAPLMELSGDLMMYDWEVFVEEGDLLTTLSDNSKMWVYFNVPETEYLGYAKSKKCRKASSG